MQIVEATGSVLNIDTYGYNGDFYFPNELSLSEVVDEFTTVANTGLAADKNVLANLFDGLEARCKECGSQPLQILAVYGVELEKAKTLLEYASAVRTKIQAAMQPAIAE